MDGTPGELLAEVSQLEAELMARPGDTELRERLAIALATSSVEVRSLTRDQVPVFTSTRQREFCSYAAGRLIALGAGGETIQASARALLVELEAGEKWVWRNRNLSVLLAALVVTAGLTVVVFGALAGNIPVVVAAGVLGSLGLAAVVFTRRKQRWQLDAERAIPVIWRHGI